MASARSPDMSPLDFFLRSYMKSLIYEISMESEMSLVARMVFDTGRIAKNPRIFERVWHPIAL